MHTPSGLAGTSTLVFGSIICLLIIAIVFIIGLSIGVGSHGSIAFANDTLSAWVSALATVCIAILTIFLAKETWALRVIQLAQIEQIRKDSIRPSVNLYLKSASAGFNFIDLHIVNSGLGVAHNIKFRFTNRSKETKDVFDHIQQWLDELVILRNGISSLGAGEERTSFLFSFFELHQKFGDRALEHVAEVDIEFEDIEGKAYSSKSYFNFTEYKGISKLGEGDPLYKISSTLEKLQRDIGHFASGFNRLKTDIYSSDDRKIEREEWEKQKDERKQSEPA